MQKEKKAKEKVECIICGKEIVNNKKASCVRYKSGAVFVCEKESDIVAALIVNLMAYGNIFRGEKLDIMTDRIGDEKRGGFL